MYLKKYFLSLILLLSIVASHAAITPDSLYVSGVATPAAANGIYVKQSGTTGSLSYPYWKHVSQAYYIYADVYSSAYYWNIDVDLSDSDVLFYGYGDNRTDVSYFTANYYSPTLITDYLTSSGTETSVGVTITKYTTAPEISVSGNGTSIVSGDFAPSIDDYTDFDSAVVASGSVRIFTIKNTNAFSLPLNLTGTPIVAISGTHASDFSVSVQPGSSIAASDSAKFTVVFTPSAGGVRSATISIANNDSDENPYTFSIQGTGLTVPSVTTTGASSISSTAALLGGSITDNGGATVDECGVLYSSEDETPTLAEGATQVTIDCGTGDFSQTVNSLSSNTIHYYLAYAHNSIGYGYGDVLSLTTLPAVTAPIAGSGSSDSPYEIASLENLSWLSQTPSVWDRYFIQTAEIDASATNGWYVGAGFSPIGDGSMPFTGHYNGKGNTISGLYINRSGAAYVGLFGYIESGATVDSLGVLADSITGDSYVGILAGYNNGVVSFTHSSGIVTGTNITGGLIGSNNAGSVLTYSYSSATANGVNNVGALVGTNENGSSIGFCYATGNSVGGTSDENYTSGGLVGYNGSGSTIRNSYAMGNATGYDHVGGLVGSNYGFVAYSYAVGNATGSMNVGGLNGSNDGNEEYYNFYNRDIFTGSTSYGMGKSSDSLKLQSTFTDAGWDFTDTWVLYEGQTYPMLRAFMTPLTVTAKDSVKPYDGAVFSGGNGVSYSLASPDKSLLLGSLGFSGSSQAVKDTGSYAITPEGLYSSQQGYLITFVDGSLKINPKTLTITGVTASDKVYDATTIATLTGGKLTGVITGDAVTLTKGTGTFANVNAGTDKTVTATGYAISGASATNYVLAAQPSGLKADITAYPITVNARDTSKVYGASDPVFPYSATALLGNDKWSGALSRELGTPVGTYDILIGTLDAGDNYEVTFNGAAFSILKSSSILTPALVENSSVRFVPEGLMVQGIRGRLDVFNLNGTRVATLNVTTDGIYKFNQTPGIYMLKSAQGNWKVVQK